jgi:hypothetical protein
LEGTIDSIDESSLEINTTNGQSIELVNQIWRYVQDQGSFPSLGDQVTIEAFFDDYGSLEIASIENLTNGQSLTLRDESGRPMWAGR